MPKYDAILKDLVLNTTEKSCPRLVAPKKQCKIPLGNKEFLTSFSCKGQKILCFLSNKHKSIRYCPKRYLYWMRN